MSTALSSRDVMVRLHLQGAPFVRADLARYKPKPRASTISTCMIEDDAIVENFFIQEETQNIEQNLVVNTFTLPSGWQSTSLDGNQIVGQEMEVEE